MSYTLSPNGGVKNGADITGNAQFFTVHTVVAHTAGDYGVSASAARNTLRLAQAIQQVANLHYLNITSAVVDLSVAANRTALGLGTDYNQAATTVYTIKFATEQSGYMSADVLTSLLDGQAVVFPTAGVPITGPATRTESLYETNSATAKNINILVFDNL